MTRHQNQIMKNLINLWKKSIIKIRASVRYALGNEHWEKLKRSKRKRQSSCRNKLKNCNCWINSPFKMMMVNRHLLNRIKITKPRWLKLLSKTFWFKNQETIRETQASPKSEKTVKQWGKTKCTNFNPTTTSSMINKSTERVSIPIIITITTCSINSMLIKLQIFKANNTNTMMKVKAFNQKEIFFNNK